jgi:hypothetical protein
MVWNRRNLDPKSYGRASYPTYDMKYLENALTDDTGSKYENTLPMNSAAKMVYTQKAATHFRREADNSLRSEFSSWLEGMHADNATTSIYENNRPGVTERRHFMNGKVGARDGWKPTWWGKAQLTHLPGVRDYLIEKKIASEQDTFDANQLAELGPQNIDEAWSYFKTWVKGMPSSESVSMRDAVIDHIPNRSNAGPIMPIDMFNADPMSIANDTPTSKRKSDKDDPMKGVKDSLWEEDERERDAFGSPPSERSADGQFERVARE